jgi:hypothetical protein
LTAASVITASFTEPIRQMACRHRLLFGHVCRPDDEISAKPWTRVNGIAAGFPSLRRLLPKAIVAAINFDRVIIEGVQNDEWPIESQAAEVDVPVHDTAGHTFARSNLTEIELGGH